MCLGSMSPSTCHYADITFESSADRSSYPLPRAASDRQRSSITWSIWATSQILESARQDTGETAPRKRRQIRDSRHSFERTPAMRLPRKVHKRFHSRNVHRRRVSRIQVMSEGKSDRPVRRGIPLREQIFAAARRRSSIRTSFRAPNARLFCPMIW